VIYAEFVYLMKSQQDFLELAKKTLDARFGKLTWEEFAAKAGLEPRTLKSYRSPETSKSNYREMPFLVRQAIETLLTSPERDSGDVSVVIGALAALVIRQARAGLVDHQTITGLSRFPGSRSGLGREDRKAMALVSRLCMEASLPDFGGEIHDLLTRCREPLQDWLKAPKIMESGYGATVLIDPDHGIPTPEAQDLAESFGSITAHLEERLFAAFKDALAKFPQESADEYYATIREFVVRNPVVTSAALLAIGKVLPPVLWLPVQREFYEPFPAAYSGTPLQLCAHCNSLLRLRKHGIALLACQSRACRNERPMREGVSISADEAYRVTAALHQFWVEPGIHEIWLYDALKAQYMDVALYPYQDRVDIGAPNESFGIDLKAYASAETLGLKLRSGIGGLSHYQKKLLVVPDWIVNSQAGYLDRLRAAIGDNASRLTICAVSEVTSALQATTTRGVARA
jgi:hypothetical protein